MIDGMRVECANADVVRAEIVVHVGLATPLPQGGKLCGAVRGPVSERSHTLPAEFPLHVGPDHTLRGVIVDPCYSTATLDMQYEIDVQVVDEGGQVLADHRTRIRLASRNRD